MEQYMGYLSSFMLAITLGSIAIQLIYGYALQCLANKNDMSSMAQTLAWIPLLNIYPFIVCGGGSFPRFMIGITVFIAGLIGMGFFAGSGGAAPVVIAITMVVMGLGTTFYFGRLFWRTAERRGLHGFIGLLNFVPIVNLFVYPYIAFHDGFVPVNKVGAFVGFLLIAGPSIAQYQMFDMATSTLQAQMTEAMENGTLADMTESPEESSPSRGFGQSATPNRADASSARAMQLGMQLSMLGVLDPSNSEERAELEIQLGKIREQFIEIETSLPHDRAGSLHQALATAERRLMDVQSPALAQSSPQYASLPTSRTAMPGAASPPAAPALVAIAAVDPSRGYSVPDDLSCQSNSVRKSETDRTWCERPGGGLKHGWLSARHTNGKLALAGEYHDGLRHGVWTRWYEDGSLRVQAPFDRGLQEGRMIAWNPDGSVSANVLYTEGEVVQH